MQLRNIPDDGEHEIRESLHQMQENRSRAERWAALNDRIDAYEQSRYIWLPRKVQWFDVYRAAILMDLWPLVRPKAIF